MKKEQINSKVEPNFQKKKPLTIATNFACFCVCARAFSNKLVIINHKHNMIIFSHLFSGVPRGQGDGG